MGALMSMMVLCSGCNLLLTGIFGFHCPLNTPVSTNITIPSSWTNREFLTIVKEAVAQRSEQLRPTKDCLPSDGCYSSNWGDDFEITAYSSTDGFLEINDYTDLEHVGLSARIERIDNSTAKISFYGIGPYCDEWGGEYEMNIFKDLFLKAIDKHKNAVMPSSAGIQKNHHDLDTRLRGHDDTH